MKTIEDIVQDISSDFRDDGMVSQLAGFIRNPVKPHCFL